MDDDSRRVLDPERDPAALKALTHPLRLRLLGLLRLRGPATASELADRTGESSASTSYHLRVLAKHAFVAEAEHRDGRERRWKAVHSVTSWSNAAVLAAPGSRGLLETSRQRQLEHLRETVERHEADIATGRLGREWHEPSGISDLMPRLTPESLSELLDTVNAKLAELTARDADDPRAEQVVTVVAALPLASAEPAEGRAGGRPVQHPATASGDGAAADGAADGERGADGAPLADAEPGAGPATVREPRSGDDR
ncbi:helix-turn-helix domain-containing protein [Streptomyces halstedii]|uniref:helix-turn-helix domain-containing protein n=1 Tax=Streptomyces halstedii TaxID=1944 RepID=UPI0033A85773